VIPVVSGFQVAGFPHVIGSLRPAGDREFVAVVSRFYSSLIEHKDMLKLGSQQVAQALQQAVVAVRTEDMDMPLNWAQFVLYTSVLNVTTILKSPCCGIARKD
jgi:CHAT domain-containing protein